MILQFGGKSPRIDPEAWVAPGAVVAGDVEIAAHCGIWFNAVVRGDVHFVRIGPHTNVQDGAVLHVTGGTAPLVIEDHVTIGHGAVVHGCTLRHHVLVGMNATVLDGAEIGAECIIGAGALVPEGKSVPPGCLVVGVPGKVVRSLTDQERAGLHTHAARYAELAAQYR